MTPAKLTAGPFILDMRLRPGARNDRPGGRTRQLAVIHGFPLQKRGQTPYCGKRLIEPDQLVGGGEGNLLELVPVFGGP
jgi:hypothetical protein